MNGAQPIFNSNKHLTLMYLDRKGARSVMQQTADSVNQMNRSFFPNSFLSCGVSCSFVGNQLWDGLHRWLSPSDLSTNHNIACSTYQKRMASWFFWGSIFARWKSTISKPFLWIHRKHAPHLTSLLLARHPLTTYYICSWLRQECSMVCESFTIWKK